MAALTLLQLVQQFCARRGLAPPTSVTSATDDNTRQMWGLLNEGITDFVDRYEWQQIINSYSFTHAELPIAEGDYGALDISESGPLPDFKAMLNRTLWNNSTRIEVYGPLDPKTRQQILAMQIQPTQYSYWLQNNKLVIYPAPDPPEDTTFAMQYVSRYGVFDPVSSSNQLWFVSDTSICLLPSQIMLADLKWRWQKEKGLPYAEDFRTFEGLVTNAASRESAPDIILDNPGFEQVVGPGLYVAAGSWPIT